MIQFFDFGIEPMNVLLGGTVSACEHEVRDHVVVFREVDPDYENVVYVSRMGPPRTNVVSGIWICCVDCAENYRSGYMCELYHFNGDDCGIPFVDCTLHPPAVRISEPHYWGEGDWEDG